LAAIFFIGAFINRRILSELSMTMSTNLIFSDKAID
jgi:hypothetical protein